MNSEKKYVKNLSLPYIDLSFYYYFLKQILLNIKIDSYKVLSFDSL